MDLVEFSIKGTIYKLVIDKKRQDKTIKKIVIDKLWKEFHHYGDRKQAMTDITITYKIAFECEGCGRPVNLEEYMHNKAVCCQDCFETTYLPFIYDLAARTPNYKLIYDDDSISIISQ